LQIFIEAVAEGIKKIIQYTPWQATF